MTTGERIKAARKQAGMTQQELADKLQISYVGVSQWESGRRNPKQDTLTKIADVLDVPLNYLTGSHYLGDREIAEFIFRAWPRADCHLKLLREEGEPEEIERWERVCMELRRIRDEIVAEHNTQLEKLSEQEEILLEIFRKLNIVGKQKIIAIATDYAKIQDYFLPPEGR